MRAGRWLLAAALAGAGATWGIAPGASAQSGSYVHGIDGVVQAGCQYLPFEYAVAADRAAYHWSLKVTAYDPAGADVGSSWLWKDDGDPASGRVDKGIRICNGEAGRYRLAARLNLYLAPYDDEELPESSFTVRDADSRPAPATGLPVSATTLSVDDRTPKVGQQVRFRIRSRVERPTGFVANARSRVALEKRTPHGWVRVGSASTNARGAGLVEVRWRNRMARAVRAVTPRTGTHRRSLSARIRIG